MYLKYVNTVQVLILIHIPIHVLTFIHEQLIVHENVVQYFCGHISLDTGTIESSDF
jgi:hypothetical protein